MRVLRSLQRAGVLRVSILAVAAATLVGAATSAPALGALPHGRAYELVSPPDKNGGDIAGSATNVRAAADGNAVSFLSFSGFADVTGAGLSFEYVAQRSAGQSWLTHSIQPSQEPAGADLIGFSQHPYYQGEFSRDLSKGVVRTLSPLSDAPTPATRNLYVRTDLRTPGSGTYELVTASALPIPPLGSSPNIVNYRPAFADASSDFGHVLFESRLNLTTDAPPQPAACATNFNQCRPRVYEFDHGTVRLAGILPDGSAAPSSAAGRGASAARYADTALSEDGRRIFFIAPVSNGGLATTGSRAYMREDASTTVEISESERTDCAGDLSCGGDGRPDPAPDPGGPMPVTFWAATADGSRAFFTTAEQLTDDDENGTVDLYAFDATRAATDPDNLSRLSVDTELDDGDGAVVQGVIGVANDGSYVYFVAGGQLVDGAPQEGALAGFHDVYVWHDGVVRNIGYISPQDTASNVASGTFGLTRHSARVTPDGTHMAFTSEFGDGLTGYDHGTACGTGGGPGCSELYLFDAEANGGSGRLVCASCNPTGAAATADASALLEIGTGAAPPTAHRPRFLSEDGRRVFFTTGERLVAEDNNGVTPDVYVYDAETDSVGMISRGIDDDGSYFMEASASGDDVFFVTRDRLVGWDVDVNYDLYDARVGGGLPEPPPPPARCAGEACRGPVSSPPTGALPGSATFTGGGNRGRGGLGSIPVFFLLPLGRGVRSTWARTGQTSVRVRVSQAGVVRVRAVARVAGATRTVARASRRARGGGVVRLRLKLTSAARRHLAAGRSLRVTVIARYSEQSGAQRMVTTLRLPKSRASTATATRGGHR
jgi:hypothetical protein